MAVIETDVAIIGAGVAGLSAAEALANAGLQVLVIERMGAGGQVMTVEHIANFPAFPDGVSGFELGPLLQERAEDAGAQFMLADVQRVESRDGVHLLQLEGETVRARAVVIAAGSQRRKLGVPGEQELEGRGVSHCASCDGPLFRGEDVCVVGGGDSALGEAQILATHARSVTIVFREEEPKAQEYVRAAVLPLPNVTVLPHADVVRVEGEQQVQGVRVRLPGGEEQTVAAQGVFVYAGLQADSGPLREWVALDEHGRVRTDAAFAASVPGVFAAGDIRAGAAYRLADAAAEGAAAAASVVHYMMEVA